jgi:hypothetical protein
MPAGNTNYPTSLDTSTNLPDPAGVDLDGDGNDHKLHSNQHSTANEAIIAIESKLGIGSSPATSAPTGGVLTKKSDGSTQWTDPNAVQTTQSGNSYTFVLGDANNFIDFTSSSATAVTVPLNSSVAFPKGTVFVVRQWGTGLVTLSGAVGVTLRSRSNALKSGGQYAWITLMKRDNADEWAVTGDVVV